jgi:hypothetical protein
LNVFSVIATGSHECAPDDGRREATDRAEHRIASVASLRNDDGDDFRLSPVGPLWMSAMLP